MKETLPVNHDEKVRKRVEKWEIAVMPDIETLEEYLKGKLTGKVTVFFDIRTGTFEPTKKEVNKET